MNLNKKKLSIAILMSAIMIVSAACGNTDTASEGTKTETNQSTQSNTQENTPAESEKKLSGSIEIDGSSTVHPITEAVAEEFGKEHSDVRVPVGVSGTGGGFKRFCAGETAISNASRPIKDEEAEKCKAAGIDYVELEVAYDGLSVVVNKDNDWVDHLTVDELNAIFKPGSTVKTWKDVRPEWPNETIKLYSPGADSGTFDYFTEAVNGKAQESRNDSQISFSEDDNTLVQGVAGEKYGLGYFGFAYYEENADTLKLVPIDGGKGAIAPSAETINDGTYAPLSRPLYVYVSKKALEREEVRAFAEFYVKNAATLAEEVGYIRLPQEEYDKDMEALKG
ncbi:PstS family phosphate ABC transporter substrate-binding protein [Paenibacillus sp. 1001270B_150601_E10]|uniref:PstS family phosphate ABC transporter substrate-binding protein n=1 Tax=Paenibacillus sp. 1001270B_150601_E10 TaxID=2787079 RepID=UPI0018A0E183|nr:PstS family phosphate ABC transporter substrate-binding protein [Paenibacillus sp. 1001270B_150601_E10]